jgi:hypothetical protein
VLGERIVSAGREEGRRYELPDEFVVLGFARQLEQFGVGQYVGTVSCAPRRRCWTGTRAMSRALTGVRRRFPGLEIQLIATNDESGADDVCRDRPWAG